VNRDANREPLARTLQAEPDCLPLERLGSPLSPADREHLDQCPRCQTELALLEASDSPDSPDERTDVRWVTEQLRNRRRGDRRAPSPARTPWLSVPRLLPIAATLAFALLIGYSVWDPEPKLGPVRSGQQVYRAGSVEGLKPSGDLPAVPGTLEWSPYAGATRYDVSISEVDGTSLWNSSSEVPRVELPSSLKARFLPGKTILWQVTAKDASGVALADSGPQTFRVSIPRQ
jgi:hypothetical protein